MEQLHQGSTGSAVVDLQTKLIYLGYDCGPSGVDGHFGPATHNAVILFQRNHGLVQDGWVGPLTMDALNRAYYGRN